MYRPLRVLDAARSVVDDVNALLNGGKCRLLSDWQLRRSAASVAANIREALGRREGRERNQFLRFARGSAEETDEHLRVNWAGSRLATARWGLHHRLMVIIKMLNAMMKE